MTDSWFINGVLEIGALDDIIRYFITAILSGYLESVIRGNL